MTRDNTPNQSLGTVDWSELNRPLPEWYRDAKFGIMVHWRAYSVPAWAEPIGELGTVASETWFHHSPYAEWYWNTIRFEDSPARQFHRETYGDAPYDDFLDAWVVDAFEPDRWLELFSEAGAKYIVPTSKHHDGITLWDAPGTATRNTVHRGPKRDLLQAIERATRKAGLRFGVYYSGGLDWSISNLPPIDAIPGLDIFGPARTIRPRDAAYAAYAYLHVRDLIDRYKPALIWNDIEWPDAGKHGGSLGLLELFRHYYATVPDGVVNDRWGDTHSDYLTSEYKARLELEKAGAWENTRGIGLSFGYNRVEDARCTLSGLELLRHLVDIVSRGGNLLLNVGPTAGGAIPDLQREALNYLGRWMRDGTAAIHGSRPLETAVARTSDEPWVRWTKNVDFAWAILDRPGPVILDLNPEAIEIGSAVTASGQPVEAKWDGDRCLLQLDPAADDLPPLVRFPLR
jgi:alpha-L-fucosidase